MSKEKTFEQMIQEQLSFTPEGQAREKAYAVANAVLCAMCQGNTAMPVTAIISRFEQLADGFYQKILKDSEALTKGITPNDKAD